MRVKHGDIKSGGERNRPQRLPEEEKEEMERELRTEQTVREKQRPV